MGITKTQPTHHPCREKSHLSVVVHLDVSVFIQSQLEEAGAAAWGLLWGERSASWVKENSWLRAGISTDRTRYQVLSQPSAHRLCLACCVPVKWN